MNASIIALNQAAFGYDDRAILSATTLDLEPGRFYFLTGPSGAGKTTFLRLCYLDLVPSGGTLSLFGRDAADMSRDGVARARRRIGVTHQDCRFLDHLSLRENVGLPLLVAGKEPEAEAHNIDQLLEWVGLDHRTDALPPELSGGEKQRAALARAVVMSPELILADEPTGNVDWEMSERLLGLLVELNRMGKTVLMATHDMPLIRSAKSRVSTRVMRLKGGQIEMAGTDL